MANDRRLEKLLATYEHAVRTLRDAIALLNGGAPASFPLPPSANGNGNGNGHSRYGGDRRSTAYRLAERLDAERRATKAATAPTKAPKAARTKGPKYYATRTAQRTVSARLLDQFDQTDPKRTTDIRGNARVVGSLVRRGYLAKKGNGYVRTEKPFLINPNTAGR